MIENAMKPWAEGQLELEVRWSEDNNKWVKSSKVFTEDDGIKASELTHQQVADASTKAAKAFIRRLKGLQEYETKEIKDMEYRLAGLAGHIAINASDLNDCMYHRSIMMSMSTVVNRLKRLEELIPEYKKLLREYQIANEKK